MTKRYSVILADPPWTYGNPIFLKQFKSHRGNKHSPSSHYSTMTTAQIGQLCVDKIASKDAMLFLWVTNPILEEGLEIIKAWGFKFKTVAFTWIKLNRDGSPFKGMGNYTRGNSELCLLGVRGRIKQLIKTSNKPSQIIATKRWNQSGKFHSAKPNQCYERIELLLGEVPKIELFARRRRLGWDAWGNEIDSDIQLGGDSG